MLGSSFHSEEGNGVALTLRIGGIRSVVHRVPVARGVMLGGGIFVGGGGTIWPTGMRVGGCVDGVIITAYGAVVRW